MVRMLGMQSSSFVGASFETLVTAPADKVASYLKICARSRQLIPGSFRWVGKSDAAADVRCDGMALAPRTETAPAVLFIRCRPKAEATDQFALLNQKISDLSKEILERKKAELQRDELLVSERAARVDAEQATRIRDEFLATLSHELRTPLSSIQGWTQILLHPDAKEADFAKGIATIQRNVKLQVEIVEDLLDMSRIITGKIRLDVRRVNLVEIIEAALEAMRPAAEAKGIRVKVTLDTLVGPVRGDASRLQQVLWNLLSNAVKFTPKGGQVKVCLERVDSHVEISVNDSGEGIPPAFLPHVFDRFRQADSSSTRKHGGLGLGLAIVKQLVELHGGKVHAKSPGPGKGATFLVVLPLMPLLDALPQDADIAAPARADASVALEAPSLSGIKVLVVDDDEDTRQVLKGLLELHRAEVVAAHSAAEALHIVARGGIDLVLCDIGMAGTDGYAFITALRSRSPELGGSIPAIAVTAFARVEDRTRALLAGFSAHLAKPVDSLELVATVASIAGRPRLQD
jgi:signal transduction histidine kinase/CheY-like chemotaxis protein